MPTQELKSYRYRGARALVILHEKGMRELLPGVAPRGGRQGPASDHR